MARFLADSIELQDPTNGLWGTIASGGLDTAPPVRGSDWEIPGKAGRDPGVRVADRMPIVISMWLAGDGSTHAAIRASYRTRMAALLAVFDPTRDYVTNPIDLVVHPDAEGVGGAVAGGDTAAISVRFLRLVGPLAIADEARQFELECESIDSPPAWVIT